MKKKANPMPEKDDKKRAKKQRRKENRCYRKGHEWESYEPPPSMFHKRCQRCGKIGYMSETAYYQMIDGCA